MPICQTCGTDNDGDSRFCKSCGRSLDAAEPNGAATIDDPAPVDKPVEGGAPLLAADGLPVGVDLDGEPGGERQLWKGRPFGPFSPILRVTRRYRVTNERMQIDRGFISRSTEEVDLYRVTDVEVKQNLWGRIFGYGSVTVYAPTNASIESPGKGYRLRDIRKPDYVKDLIRQAARIERQRRRVLLRDEV
jgi:hypothetical protein